MEKGSQWGPRGKPPPDVCLAFIILNSPDPHKTQNVISVYLQYILFVFTSDVY